MTESAGYSGTPLIRKLGLKSGSTVRLLDAPDHYWETIGQVPDELGIALLDEDGGTADFTHLFATRQDALDRTFEIARDGMAEDGMVWASWPKKSSGVESEIGRSEVMAAGKAVGLVDVKVCAVDEIWSGLRFVIPVDRRGDG